MTDWRPSFEAFLAENKALFVQWTKRYCGVNGVPHLVEDILQDAIAIVIKNWPNKLIVSPDEGYPRAFMCVTLQQLARNAGDRRRTERRHHRVCIDELESSRLLTNQVSTEHLILADAARQEVHAALKALPPRQRQIVELRKIGELSVKQIAQHLELSETDVTTSMNKAKQKLRTFLSPKLIEDFENAKPNVMLSKGGGAA